MPKLTEPLTDEVKSVFQEFLKGVYDISMRYIPKEKWPEYMQESMRYAIDFNWTEDDKA